MMNFTANSIVPDSFQAFLVEGAHFTKTEEYPCIPAGIISPAIPNSIIPFDRAITLHGDLSNTFICFYSPDKTFERVRKNPQKYVSFFKRTAGIIGFDFSIHSDMPLIKQKAQMYDNLSFTYFFGKQGIPIIPNLRVGISELAPEYLEAIPKNTYVAIGTHGFIKGSADKYTWYEFIETFLNILHPKGVIVYGSLRSRLFQPLIKDTPFYYYKPWINARWEEVHRHVN